MYAETDLLLPQHQKQLDDSGIAPEVAKARGYRSAVAIDELAGEGFEDFQRLIPALLLPVWTVDGTQAFCQLRPDEPRKKSGKAIKYETPDGRGMAIDVPPDIRDELGDPKIPLYITEGIRKADAAVSQGLCCIDLLGVWNWRGKNDKGGLTALADWEAIALNGRIIYLVFDSDIMTKPSPQAAVQRLKKFLESKKAAVSILRLPPAANGEKVGLDDFLAAGGDLEPLIAEALNDIGFEQTSTLTEPLDDIGDAKRFAARNRGEIAWSPHHKAWLVWKSELRGTGIGGRWVEDVGEIEATRRAKLMVSSWYVEALTLVDDDKKRLIKHAIECGAYHRLQSILKSSRDVLAVDITTFDQDDWILNCLNGVLDLRTFTLRSAEPTDRCRWQTDVEYVPGFRDAQFERFLMENIPDEQTREFNQQIAGYALLGDRTLEIMADAYGPKRSGKTTFAEMPRTNLGSYAATVPPEFFMTTDRPFGAEANRPLLASLVNKRLVTSAEGNKQHVFDVAFVKRLTGRDPVVACAKYGHPFEYMPKFFILIYGNYRPKADADEDAMRSRLYELPFPVGREPDQVDADLKDHLLKNPSAKRAWLAWAVEGLRRLVANKMKLVPPAQVKASTDEYWAEQNALGPFLKKLVLDKDGFVVSADLMTEFNTWTMETASDLRMGDMIEWLKANKCENDSRRIPGGGRTARGWAGVRWAPDVTLSRPVTPVEGNSSIRSPQRKVPANRVTPRDGVTPRPQVAPAWARRRETP